MVRRDPERAEKIRIAVRYLLAKDGLASGYQTRLAEHFGISRQRVNQIVLEERKRAQRQARAEEGATFRIRPETSRTIFRAS